MDFTYDLVPLVVGLVFGALIGVLVTDSPRTLMRRTRSRTAGGEQTKLSLVFGWPWKLYVIIGLVIILAVIIYLTPHSRFIVLGSVVGFIAAPWVWLHFARDFLTASERGNDGADKLLQEYL